MSIVGQVLVGLLAIACGIVSPFIITYFFSKFGPK
jgi:hypothetical protein